MTKYSFIILVFLITIFSGTKAQVSISGVVLDESGKKMDHVNVFTRDSAAFTTTNYKGVFQLNIPDGTTELTFDKEGYLNTTITVNLNEKMQVVLKSSEYKTLLELPIEELLQLKISSASRHEEKISDIPASVVVLTRKDIERYGFTSFTEALQHVPGLYMIDDRYWLGSVNFGVRGFFSTGPFNNMVILVNGVSQLSDKYSDYPDNKINVPIESIERIEVIRGPMSVLYGTGAFFGVINIITNSDADQWPDSRASVSYGTYNTKKTNASVVVKDHLMKFSLNASLTSTKGIDVPFTSMTSDTNLLRYVGLAPDATTAGQSDDNRKYFNVTMNYKGFFSDITYTESTKDIFDGQPGFGKGCSLLTKAQNLVAGYENQFSPTFYGKVKVGYYNHDHLLDYEVFRPNYYEVDQQDTRSADIDLYAFWKPNNLFEMVSGLYRRTVIDIYQLSDFSYYGFNNGGGEIGLPEDEHFSTSAIYSQVKYNPTEKLILIAGGRIEHLDNYDINYTRGLISEDPADGRSPDSANFRKHYFATYHPDHHGFTLVPRFAVLYKINNNHSLKILYGNATKQPSYSENYRQLPKGRPFLNAADITTMEINYIASISKRYNINLSYFHNQLDNLISNTNVRDTASGEWLIYNTNSGRLQTNGVEASVDALPLDQLSFSISGIFQKSVNLDASMKKISPGYSPNFLAYAKACWTPVNNFSLGITARYVGEMETEWSVKDNARIGKSIGAYTVIDFNIHLEKISRTGIFTNFHIGNITDTDIRFPTTLSNVWMDKGYPGPGRTYLLTIGYSF